MTAEGLGFKSVSRNSIDAVSDRDFCAEFVFCCSILMMHLSRLSEELVLWSAKEFDFVDLGDGFTTGSSIMPQKKKSRHVGTHPGKNRQGLRKPERTSDFDERTSAFLQQGHAGGQRASFRYG